MFLGEWHAGLPVRVSTVCPVTTAHPETGEQETHHGAIVEGVLFCSQAAWDQLKTYKESERRGQGGTVR